jgi:8-oxo-dGTP diphosphatase
MQIINTILNKLEQWIRLFVVFITNYLPVKVIRDDKGVPFLYRYHLFSLTADGPGMCIHHFVKSDPERGYHDHPWKQAVSFILCGNYKERILRNDADDKNETVGKSYVEYQRDRWTFNFLSGEGTFHRVMIEEDAWTIFAFQKRSKLWGMVSLDGEYKNMSETISDGDGGWWNFLGKGLGVHEHLEHSGKVIATADSVIVAESKVLLIKRGKEPFKGQWAFPGGRIEQKDKDILEAANRELYEETGLKGIELKYAKTIGNSTRDPRGFCLTCVFVAKLEKIPDNVKAGDDAVDYEWFDLDNLPDMAFDHKEILKDIL